MARKWTVGATGFAVLATTFVVVACSSKEDDDDTGDNNAAKGGTSTTGGSAGKATGGATTGGTSGTGTGGTGGSAAGMGGTVATGGMGGTTAGGMAGAAAGAAGSAAFDCSMPAAATCNLIVNWGTFAADSPFQGTYSYQEATVMVDKTTDPTKLHITGTVANYDGFGIYTGKCSSLMGYTGVTFTLSGNTMSVDKPNALKFVVQLNADEPIDATNKKGACVGASGVECVSPSKTIMPSDAPQTVNFADMTGGKPLATVDVTQVLGFQWQIDPDASATPFPIDLTLSNFSLVGGSGGPVDCSVGMGGMGGMGGMAGGGGMAGATGGQAGASGGMAGGGGMAGATGGRGGAAGAGGRGGAAGGAGRGGRGGGAGAN